MQRTFHQAQRAKQRWQHRGRIVTFLRATLATSNDDRLGQVCAWLHSFANNGGRPRPVPTAPEYTPQHRQRCPDAGGGTSKCPANFSERAGSTSVARRAARRSAAAAHVRCRARCRRVVRAPHAGGAAGVAACDTFRRSASVADGRPTEGNPSSVGGDRASIFDAPTRAIGREIQNGVPHAGASRAPRMPSVSSACSRPTSDRASRDLPSPTSRDFSLYVGWRSPESAPRSSPSDPRCGTTHVTRDASRFPAYT